MNTYMVLLVDRKMAKMFLLLDGAVERYEEVGGVYVPQKVKHGDDTWDAQDKIFRHIEDHLHWHLTLIASKAFSYAKKETIDGILIGSHKPLLAKVKKHLPQPLVRQIKGEFITELKEPFNKTLERVQHLIKNIEIEDNTLKGGKLA